METLYKGASDVDLQALKAEEEPFISGIHAEISIGWMERYVSGGRVVNIRGLEGRQIQVQIPKSDGRSSKLEGGRPNSSNTSLLPCSILELAFCSVRPFTGSNIWRRRSIPKECEWLPSVDAGSVA